MSRFNTGNPLGSDALQDLSDNAKNADLFSNDVVNESYKDRFGRNRKTIHGMESEFDRAQDERNDKFDADQKDRDDRFKEFLLSSGYQFAGDYAAGVEITEYNQIVRDENGEFWRLSGKIELPYITTGEGAPENGALVPVGDATLRQDLANPDKGAAMVGYKGSNVHDAIQSVMTSSGAGLSTQVEVGVLDKTLSRGHIQGLCAVRENGRDRFFTAQRTSDIGGYWAFEIVEYEKSGGELQAVVKSNPLVIGHGQSLSYTYIEGELYFFNSCYNDIGIGTSNDRSGLSIVKWRGAETNQSDVTKKVMIDVPDAVLSDMRIISPTVSEDGSTVAFVGYPTTGSGFLVCALYDLKTIMESDFPHTEKPNSKFNIPLSGMEDTLAYQGCAVTDSLLYVITGQGRILDANIISTYRRDGSLVGYQLIDNVRSREGGAGFLTKNSEGKYLIFSEPEDICVSGGRVFMSTIYRYATGSDVVSYKGSNYRCLSGGGTSEPPLTGSRWAPTLDDANRGEFDPEQTYSYGVADDLEIAVYEYGDSLPSSTYSSAMYERLYGEGLNASSRYLGVTSGSTNIAVVDFLKGTVRDAFTFNNGTTITMRGPREDLPQNTLDIRNVVSDYGGANYWNIQNPSKRSHQITAYHLDDTRFGVHNSGRFVLFNPKDDVVENRAAIEVSRNGNTTLKSYDGVFAGGQDTDHNLATLTLDRASELSPVYLMFSRSGRYATHRYTQHRYTVGISPGDEGFSWGTISDHTSTHTPYDYWYSMTADSFYPEGAVNRNLGTTARPFEDLYLTNSPSVSSDMRLKTGLEVVSDSVLDAWGRVRVGAFKWLSAIDEKGDEARYHFGVLAQEIIESFELEGVDATEYGIVCLGEGVGGVARWKIRPIECLWLEKMYSDREFARLNERILALESRFT